MVADDLVRDRPACERDLHHVAARALHRLAYRLAHFVRLPRGDADVTLAVAHGDEGVEAEARQLQRMAWRARWPEHIRFDLGPRVDDRPDQPPVGGRVILQLGRRALDRSMNDGARPIVEGVREHRSRLDPFEAVRFERQRAKERRLGRERMNRRADVVHEARQSQLCRANAAAEGRLGFENDDLAAGLRDDDRRGEAVRT